MAQTQPTDEQVRELLENAGLTMAAAEISYLGDGWDCWAFLAGELVVRMPKLPRHAEKLRSEAKLSPMLATILPTPIPMLEFHSLPDGGGFTTHKIVAGVPLRDLKRPPSAEFGKQ